MIYYNEVNRSSTSSPLLTKCQCNQCGAIEVRPFADVGDDFICGSCIDEVNHITEAYFSEEWY